MTSAATDGFEPPFTCGSIVIYVGDRRVRTEAVLVSEQAIEFAFAEAVERGTYLRLNFSLTSASGACRWYEADGVVTSRSHGGTRCRVGIRYSTLDAAVARELRQFAAVPKTMRRPGPPDAPAPARRPAELSRIERGSAPAASPLADTSSRRGVAPGGRAAPPRDPPAPPDAPPPPEPRREELRHIYREALGQVTGPKSRWRR